ncbi:PrsW family intramembrane metalloprotease [Aquipuribacter hungaricus]|uniref:PrsW family intramembrane metalloprotease n=1 Tax=Aquipuribacter hungaricus TaxID=545624 RepID=A0ABV7WJM9_9MICO
MVHPQPLPVPAPPVRGGGRAGQVVLAVLGGLLVVVCGLVVTVVVLLSVGPEAFATALLVAALPVLPLVRVYAWLDRYEPEPRGMLLFAFGWGAAVATAFALLLSLPPTLAVQALGGDADVLGAVLVAPLVEEGIKGLGLVAVVLVGRRGLDGLVDGFVYAGLVGVGFAFTENILYLGEALLSGGSGGLVATFVVRGVVSPFAHPLFTAATGVGLVLASRRRGAARLLVALAGFAVAVLLHGLWNGMAVGGTAGFAGTYLTMWVPLFCAFVALALWARARQARTVRSGIALYARYGWFSPAEEQMLVSLPARRHAQRVARRSGSGPAMRRFQTAAIDLAHLRERVGAGTAPWDAAAREQDLLGRLTAARSALGAPPGLRERA